MNPWRILVVDDDESVHSITRVILRDIIYDGRGVEVLGAFSGREASEVLRKNDDIAVVLLDVVMESDDAGLRLVREIREDMRNTRLRIILRTGQPGQAPEREIIVNYDINDYKSKTELTAQKLFTATITALRSYAGIVDLEQSRAELLQHQTILEEQVAARTSELAEANRELVAAQHQINEELRVARTLQQAILPAAFPEDPAYLGSAVMRAARMIGGDFYDAFRIDDDRLGIVIGDTCGKGVPAALFMVVARAVVEQCALSGLAPGDCLTATNRAIFRRNPLSYFVTMIYGILDVRSGELTYANGGHDNPYLIHAGGLVEHLASPRSLVVGMMDGVEYPETSVKLEFGDTVVFMTDGIAECVSKDGELFGEARLEQLLQNANGREPDGIAAMLLSAVDDFSGGASLTDDVACIALQFRRPATAGQKKSSDGSSVRRVRSRGHALGTS